jgi:crossover junction endodeoxyribonuclease RuvC
MRICGIDPGIETTGYGVIESDGSNHVSVTFGAVRTPARQPFPARLLKIYEELSSLLDREQPNVVAVEEVFHAVNVQSALKLGHARGVALLSAARHGLPVFEYSPLEIKSSVTGYGRAEKRQVQEMVRFILSLPETPSPDDAADALAVAICHSHLLRRRELLAGHLR